MILYEESDASSENNHEGYFSGKNDDRSTKPTSVFSPSNYLRIRLLEVVIPSALTSSFVICNLITVEVKKEIIEKYERGIQVADIARFYNKSTSTICTLLKKKEEIKALDAAKGVTRVSKQRPRVLEDVDKLLLVWINEKQLAGDTLTENLICEKTKYLYADLVSKLPCTSTEKEGFKASRGWFDNFKRRSGIQVQLCIFTVYKA